MDRKKIKQIAIITVSVAVGVYLLVCLAMILADLINMFTQNDAARHEEIGALRYAALLSAGTECRFPLYTGSEIAEDSHLAQAELYYFPNTTGKKTKYVIIVPGGGYYECDVNKVAFPCAATINELGYTAFVLTYRCREYSSKYAPISDLARAISFITEKAEQFNVDPDDYSCIGYSAGGNLVGIFAGKDVGYAKYGVKKPKSISLIYPWIDINRSIKLNANVFQDAMSLTARFFGNQHLLGSYATEEEKKSICVQNNVDGDYPATYIIQGDNDFIISAETNSAVMVEKLKEYGVPYYYRVCEGLNHGYGLGIGTVAEGWVEECIDFWQAQIG